MTVKRDHRDNPRVRGCWPAFGAEPQPPPADGNLSLIIALCLIVLSGVLLLALR